jgi:hypothetical protein
MGVVKIVDIRIKEWKGQQKFIEMIPNFLFPLYTDKTKKWYCMPFVWPTYDTKHGQQYTMKWQHEKGTFSIRIGHKKNMYEHMTLTPRY